LAEAVAGWDLRKRWRLPAGSSDFASVDDWLTYAGSPQGNGASISRDLSPVELEELGIGISTQLIEFVEALDPVFTYLYGSADSGSDTSWEWLLAETNWTSHDLAALRDAIEGGS